MKFAVEKEKDVISVVVDLPKLVQNKETGLDTNRTVLRERDVRNYLEKENINVGRCIKGDNIDNMGNRLTALWIFMNPGEKTLDKPASAVIDSNSEVTSIPEEETKSADPKAKRRRRKTTPKKEG